MLQNRVWPTYESARAAAFAPFVLGVCQHCGFAYNTRFDPDLPQYDAEYDNDVPSPVFLRYYASIASHLRGAHRLDDGPIYDVGCGKGTFLEVLVESAPGANGVGVDPSCTPRETGPVRLVRDVFRAEVVAARPALVLCRHVVEHIADPVGFLRAIEVAVRPYEGVPVFFEVPDLEWILERGAFWDFCYEHCNYFTQGTFRETLRRAGFEGVRSTAAFEGQYQWAEGLVGRVVASEFAPLEGAVLTARVRAYAEAESGRIAAARARIVEARSAGPCVVWGMATKGVVFCNLVDPDNTLIAGSVDVNPKKQGRFAPCSGHPIHAPEWLTTLGDRPITVIVMNGNYADEIAQRCESLGVRVVIHVL